MIEGDLTCSTAVIHSVPGQIKIHLPSSSRLQASNFYSLRLVTVKIHHGPGADVSVTVRSFSCTWKLFYKGQFQMLESVSEDEVFKGLSTSLERKEIEQSEK